MFTEILQCLAAVGAGLARGDAQLEDAAGCEQRLRLAAHPQL
jgi:hypothetical protein